MEKILLHACRLIRKVEKNVSLLSIWWHIAIGCSIRIFLVMYGIWQDAQFDVKYTDIDYNVFTDAANYVVQGSSPYERHTYRYTPLLSWILTPNILVSPHFGKLLFVVFDLLTAAMIHNVVRLKGYSARMSTWCSVLWLYNPLPAAISSRGNAESIMTFLVLFTLRLCYKKQTVLAAIFYGLAVHTKIYPIIYAPSIYLHLGIGHFSKSPNWTDKLKHLVLPNYDRLVFVTVSLFTFCTLTGIFYGIYGWPFLQETYLYHISRKDTRHNFSVFFYLLYLTGESAYSTWISLVVFLPQAILVLTVSLFYFFDLPLSWFLCTVIFVMFNKVCTSQYFLWYLCLLPVLLPSLKLSIVNKISLLVLWFFGQALWLLPAYYLEFEGHNTFLYIWLASLAFFLIQIYILHVIICSYNPVYSQKNAAKKAE